MGSGVPVLLVVMKAEANCEVVLEGSGLETIVHLVLPAIGFVVAIGVGGGDRSRTESLEQGDSVRSEHGLGHGGDGGAGQLDRAELIPSAFEGVVIHRTLDAQRIGWFGDPLQVAAPLFRFKLIILARGVAAVWIVAQVGVGQAGVGFVRIEAGVSGFDFDALFEGGFRFPEQLEHRLDDAESAVLGGSVDVAEAVGGFAVKFQQIAETPGCGFLGVAIPRVLEQRVVAAVGGAVVKGGAVPFRYRR